MPTNLQDYINLMPILIVSAGAVLALIIEMFSQKSIKILPWISLGVFTASAFVSLYLINDKAESFDGMLASGGIPGLFNFLFSFGAALVTLSSAGYLKKYGSSFGEYYILVLFSVMGMMLMAGARDLFVVFIGLELMSIPFYVLAGINRNKSSANEASLKYFLLGSFATGFIVYGIALIYGTTGSTSFIKIAENLNVLFSNKLFIVGLLLVLIGFSFKIAAFPFHMWVPDVYQGSATTVTALMSSAGKTAAFSVLVTMLISSVFTIGGDILKPIFSIIAALSMLYGSVVALSQDNIKRMLAYSSIAHAGYILIGVTAGNSEGVSGVLFYLAAYTFMNLGAFGIVAMVEGENDSRLNLDAYIGLHSKKPVMAALMALFMFSLSGLPPFAGFFGKYYIFISAVESGLTWLAIIGVISSLISVYFYLRVIVLMYFKIPDTAVTVSNSRAGMTAVFISAFLIIMLGLFPGLLLDIVSGFLTF